MQELPKKYYGQFFNSFISSAPDATISAMEMLGAMKASVKVVLNLLAKQHYTSGDYAKFSESIEGCSDNEVVDRARSWVIERNESAIQKELSLELTGKQFGVVAGLFKNLRCLNHLKVSNDSSVRCLNLKGWNHVRKVTVIRCPSFERFSGVSKNRELDVDLSRKMF